MLGIWVHEFARSPRPRGELGNGLFGLERPVVVRQDNGLVFGGDRALRERKVWPKRPQPVGRLRRKLRLEEEPRPDLKLEWAYARYLAVSAVVRAILVPQPHEVCLRPDRLARS